MTKTIPNFLHRGSDAKRGAPREMEGRSPGMERGVKIREKDRAAVAAIDVMYAICLTSSTKSTSSTK